MVARRAGVSRATASRVVNSSPRVSAQIRVDVEKAIADLGYVPNRAARTLVTGRTSSIALVITEPSGRLFSDPFFPRLLRGASGVFSARDFQLVLLMPSSHDEVERTGNYLIAGHVDGVLAASLHSDDPLPARLFKADVPLVLVGRPPRGVSASYVDVDNRQGARSAVEHLVAHGRRVICTIAGPNDMAVGIDRLTGYREAIAEAGLPVDKHLEACGEFTQEGGAAAMAHLLAVRADIDGVFAASDLMAAGALSVLAQAGRRVPADVSVVGFDDSLVAASTTPPLTSVHQPIEEMGQEAARLLVEAVDGRSRAMRSVTLATAVVERASSAGRSSP
ncbi:MAG: LacI family DNA-binding transcriptional regulator [Candidatus Limnocylindrales bacterium]